jgi:hypothetical protein
MLKGVSRKSGQVGDEVVLVVLVFIVRLNVIVGISWLEILERQC